MVHNSLLMFSFESIAVGRPKVHIPRLCYLKNSSCDSSLQFGKTE